MAAVIVTPNEGEAQLLSDLLSGGPLENWTLKLFTNAVTPAETDTASTYTEAAFAGYAAATLTRAVGSGHWSTPGAASPSGGWSAEASVAEASYPAVTFTNTSASAVTVKGYYVVGATSGKVIRAATFDTDQVLNATNGTLAITPKFGLA